MTLAELQARFMDRILATPDAETGPAAPWNARIEAGLAVYRNNYRHALMEAMSSTFERTRRWVGAGAFAAAAAHHLVLHAPGGWTLDAVGDGFPATLATLFPGDPDVGDLAALEWAMHRAFTAADSACLDTSAWREATRGFDGDDWSGMRLRLSPALAVLDVGCDCVALWRALAEGDARQVAAPPARAACAIVWRDGWQPLCTLATRDEGQALRSIAGGMSYGTLCARLPGRIGAEPDAIAREAGRMLAWWLQSGLVVDVVPPRAGASA